VSYLGFKQRRVGSVTILDTEDEGRIGLRFGASTIPLPKAIESLLEQGQNQILLNLASITHINANFLGELVSSLITVNEAGGEIGLVHLTPRVHELMANTKLLTVFKTYQTELEAVDSFEERALAVGEGVIASSDSDQSVNDEAVNMSTHSI
jgi:anti-sigma B factor antagonist